DVAVRVVQHRRAAARRGSQLDELDPELVGQEHRRVEQLLARLFRDAAREEPVLAHLRRFRLAADLRLLDRSGHQLTGASRVSKMVRISSIFGTGLRNIGGSLPRMASRIPSGATSISPRMLKRPTVPWMTSVSCSMPVFFTVFATISAWRGPGKSLRPSSIVARLTAMMSSCGSTCLGQYEHA